MTQLAAIWRRAVGPFREFGAVAGALYIADRVLRSISPHLGLRVYELMVQPITGRPLLPPNLAKNLRFAEILPGDPAVAEMPAKDDVKALRFAQGARCLGAYRRDQLIGYLWLSFGGYAEDEVRCSYELAEPQTSVFDFDLYVLPAHRMGLGFMGVWHGANAWLHERGVRHTFSRLTRFNVASRKAHAHLGWRCIGRVLFVQAWAVELMLATVAPHVALTFGERQRARLRLASGAVAPQSGPAQAPPAASTRPAPAQPRPEPGPP